MNYLQELSLDIEMHFWIDTPTSRKPSATNSGVVRLANFSLAVTRVSPSPGTLVNGLDKMRLQGLFLPLLGYLKPNDEPPYVPRCLIFPPRLVRGNVINPLVDPG